MLAIIVLIYISGVQVVSCSQLQGASSCSSQRCNCEVNNGDILQMFVKSVVNQSLNDRLEAVENRFLEAERRVNESIKKFESSQRDLPVLRMAVIVRHDTSVELRNITANTGQLSMTGNDIVATINNFNPSISSTVSNLLAYRPNFADFHMSGLAGLFVNIEGLFPCVAGPPHYHPVCKLFTYEEDGFRSGHAVIDTADIGNHINIFNDTHLATYGLAFTGCPTFTAECFPAFTSHTVVCLLPKDRCG